MSSVLSLAVIFLTALGPPAAAQVYAPDLARARAAHNEGRYDEAIVAATTARRVAEIEDAAAIVLARALLERYRERADPSDLSAARETLGTVRTATLDERNRLELLLAFGEALFLEDDFGAAAELFEIGLTRAAAVDEALSEAMLEWWGTAVERQASGLTPELRKARFARLSERMQGELTRSPTSLAASYWNVVGLRGAGEPLRAWDAAVAAWVRARLVGERAPVLRADLDQLVLTGVIPDRVAHMVQDQRAAAASQLKAEWELLKERWK